MVYNQIEVMVLPIFILRKSVVFNDAFTETTEPNISAGNVLTDCETFCVAFKLGAKIMLDVLTDSPMKEI